MSKRILYLGLDPSHYSQRNLQDEVVHWPIIEIVPRSINNPFIQQCLFNFKYYSHIIVTSKSTVNILKDYLTQMRIPLTIWRKKITIVVGKVTAKQLEKNKISSIQVKVAQKETAEGVIEVLKQCDLKQAHVFWPHSSQARMIIKDFLMTNLIYHTTCILYDPLPLVSQPIPNLEMFNEIVFTSPSTIDAFLKIFGKFPSQISCIPIGPITAQYLSHFRKRSNYF